MDETVSIEARWTLLSIVIGPSSAAMLSKRATVEAVPQLAKSARQWLLTVAPVGVGDLDLAIAEQETTDLEIIAAAVDRVRRHGGGWDVLAVCQDLGLTSDLPPLPTLAPSQERYARAVHDVSRAYASLAVALRTGDAKQTGRARAYLDFKIASMNRAAKGCG